ncbi:MAG: stage III sporulation protein AE [Clostridium perfringens]|nr:stage III sporulation protein AE [Clostridium perfringens]
MKNLYKAIVISLTFMFFIAIPVYAAETKEDTTDGSSMLIEAQKELDNDSRMEKFYKYISNLQIEDELLSGLNAKEYIANYLTNKEDSISFKDIGASLISFLFREVKATLSLVVSILVIALLSALLKNIQDAFSKDEGITSIAFFACYAVLIMLLSKSFLISLDIAKEVFNSIIEFMNVLVPVLIFLISSAGGVTSALTIDPIVLAAISITPKIYTNLIFPLILIYLALLFANNISKEFSISGLCKFLKQTIMLCQGFILMVFVTILSIRGMTANTLDAVTKKSIKFAMDNFIPVVGKAFSDAISTLAACSLAMKSVISTLGVLILIAIAIYPIIKIFIVSMSLKLTGAILEPVVDSKVSSSVTMVGEALTLVMSCVICISVMFFIMISMMASSGKFIVGG